MSNILLLLFFLVSFLIFLLILTFYKKRFKRSVTKKISFFPSFAFLKEQKYNPDINTNDWDLHWKRLNSFEWSKYEGETYYKGKRGGIYTITANGNRNYKY